MKRLLVLIVALLIATPSIPAPKQAYELVSFNYEELAVWTDDVVRIEWNGVVESYLTYNGDCIVVLKMVLEDGAVHLFPTQPFSMQGLSQLELSDVFIVPRNIWDGAVSIEVDAEGLSPADYSDESESTIVARIKECLKNSLATSELFEGLKSDAVYLRERISSLEVTLMAASGLLEKKPTRDSAEKQQEELEKFESELEEVVSSLQIRAEQHCKGIFENE